MNNYSIAIDGPAGSGKSTVAKQIAKKLNLLYIDTGAMYRAVGLYCLKNGIDLKEEQKIASALKNINMSIELLQGIQNIYLNGENVTEKIRTQEVGKAASDVAAILAVRQKLVQIQRDLAKGHSVIMDGRDIGTNVLPDASVKIYLNASIEERTKRRCNELKALGKQYNSERVKKEIIQRDENDKNRKHNPLTKAKDAFEIDSSDMNIEQVTKAVLNIVKQKIADLEV
ncbi:(d)CMP kinase [Clostridium sp. MD294]|uniref:(d)CMP kinase n=1 Tax=Clostridium sp. MD294 TaxID=97138 RepID=UPI0002CC7A94|nr:(d)CMP kinase [Clostridium sp. MD294]NDO46173.1 (d)CMP kinase [Clostridium sp. MD294]USF30161.1 Cytidylate kinase [Clostridium sp. MD294]